MTRVIPAARRLREEALGALCELARQTFRRRTATRSLLLAVAQCSDEDSSDVMHGLLVASRRDVPVWPHHCDAYADDLLSTPGEVCQRCDPQIGRISLHPAVFARFCNERVRPYPFLDDGSFTPYAIVRRRGETDEVGGLELVGKLWRPEEDLLPAEPEPAPRWLELPRARELFAQVCERPDDDAPRRVLADHLLEHDHPLGEVLALSLADRLDPAAIARRDALLEAYGRRWISPLGAVIPASGAGWERGLLARADVYVRSEPAEEVRAAPAWGTVEKIRFLHRDLLVPAMVALRDVGPVRGGLRALAGASRPWGIERLHAGLEEREPTEALWRAATLPRLTHLTLEGPLVREALDRARPPWWSQLEQLTLILDCDASVTEQEAWRQRYVGRAPWVAVTRRSANTCDLGWEVATDLGGRIVLRLAGWHEDATPRTLRDMLDALPPGVDVWLAPSRHWAPLPEDAERLGAAAGRRIHIASRRPR